MLKIRLNYQLKIIFRGLTRRIILDEADETVRECVCIFRKKKKRKKEEEKHKPIEHIGYTDR